ncbi:hypothetical protein FRC11_011660 [Ceratobasidium sp. 423]|nr:hypothetical protein FRC11_011660 [Ceratobasidium sp. 423]
MSPDHLIIKHATEAQVHESALREAAYWGARAGISTDDYVELSGGFERGSFARDGRTNLWVLLPEDDPETTNFYASCITFTCDVLTLQPGQALPSPSFGHAITSVFVPEEHRGKDMPTWRK